MFDELESEEIQPGRVESLHKTSIWMNFKPKNMEIVTHQLQADLSSNYCKKSWTIALLDITKYYFTP